MPALSGNGGSDGDSTQCQNHSTDSHAYSKLVHIYNISFREITVAVLFRNKLCAPSEWSVADVGQGWRVQRPTESGCPVFHLLFAAR